MKISKSFVIDSDVVKAYTDSQSFFLKLDYELQNSIEPKLLVFKKRISLENLSSGQSENYVIRLKISLNPVGNLQLYSTTLLTIRCDYVVKIMGREASSNDKKIFEKEVAQLKSELVGKIFSKKAENLDLKIKQATSNIKRPRPEQIKRIILPGYISTGYEDLDNLLQGGLPQKFSVIMTAPCSDEREIIIENFLHSGASSGEVTFFITLDSEIGKLMAEEFKSNYYLFLCNPLADECKTNLPNVFCLNGVGGLSDINIAITKAIRQLDNSKTVPRRVCIDLISDVLLHHQEVKTRKWISGIISEFKSHGFTFIAVINSLMHPPDHVQAILGLFDGEINLYEKETKDGIETLLRIRRMYNQKYSR